MKYVSLIVLVALMQGTSPVPRQAVNNSTQATANIKHRDEDTQTNSVSSQAAIKATGNGIAESDGTEQRPIGAEHTVGISKLPPVSVAKDWADWGVWFFSFLLVVVGGLQVWLLYGTLRNLERQTQLLEHQINKERARIRIHIRDFQPKYPTEGEEDAVQIVNWGYSFYGASYAFIDESIFNIELTDSEEPKTNNFSFSTWATLPDVITPTTVLEGDSDPLVTTKFQVDSLFHQKSFIHFRGRIRYHDFTDIPRETTIYYIWKSYGPRKGRYPAVMSGRGRWEKVDLPNANHET